MTGTMATAWLMPLDFRSSCGATYVPYLARGHLRLAYLPTYLAEIGNMSLAYPVIQIAQALGRPARVARALS